MRRLLWYCAFLSTALILAKAAFSQERGGQELFGHYEPVPDWPKPLPDGPDGVKHAGWTWGSMGSVYAESPDRIWFAMRGELPLPEGAGPWTPYSLLEPRRTATGNDDGKNATCGPTERRGWERRYHHVIFVVDGQGNQVQHWAQHDKLFEAPCGRGPHKIKMSPYDPERHVWVIDDQLHLIHKFTYDGKLVMSLGTKGQRGRDAGKLFDRPTDIAWLPDGTFFISDGYGGKRVAKFDKDGKFLKDWGQAPKDPKNPGPNEFNTVHSVAVSDDRRVFVVDRGHGRMQIFDEEGKFLDMFATGPQGLNADDYPLGQVVSRPYAHLITADQTLWVTDGGTNRVLKYDLNGNYKYGWGQPGPYAGQFGGPHALTVDQAGNLYIAEVFNGRVQKFRPKKGADPSKMVGQEKRYKASSN
jgi:DNA-binding beta-propeller fold protein YncE